MEKTFFSGLLRRMTQIDEALFTHRSGEEEKD